MTSASTFQLVQVSGILIAAGVVCYRVYQQQLNLNKLKLLYQAAVRERQAERAGRIRAEKDLREARQNATALKEAPNSYAVTPIGFLRSCFSQRSGTPRQSLMVPAAKAKLTLRPDVPAACLEGLEQYSHCWLLYIFHCNTDLHRSGHGAGPPAIKAKIRVPRLNGGKMGVLATRSPHRPVPIGLSVAKIDGVCGRDLMLSGVDVVDGSPVLDVKPYVPFSDALHDARCPSWVAPETEDEPLQVAAVQLSEDVRRQLESCWLRMRSRSLYPDVLSFMGLVTQALSRDIRSIHQRVNLGGTGDSQQLGNRGDGSGVEGAGQYHVYLEGVDVSYDVDAHRVVRVRSAAVHVT